MMNFKGHFDNLKTLLMPYSNIWREEILNFYPRTLDHFSEVMIEQLEKLPKETLWKIDGKNDPSSLPKGELSQLMTDINELTLLPKIKCKPETLPQWSLIKVKNKKAHEIQTLLPFIKEIKKEYAFTSGIDIGGGVGHLARTLAHYSQLPFTSLDMDANLQKIGEKRIKKYPLPKDAAEVNFKNLKFGDDQNKEILKSIFLPDSLSIGLHTCGPLAIEHVKANIKFKTKGLLNFGCCYAKLNPIKDLHLSNHAKIKPFDFTIHALTLATRGHGKFDFSDFLFKEQVKKWRYTLHLLLYFEKGITNFIPVGEAPLSLYQGSFSDYALLKLRQLKINHQFTNDFLDNFVKDKKIEQEVRRMFLSNIIRWRFGRVIEHYILTDRCLYLEEHGLKTSMLEFFDSDLSPRNIGIFAVSN